MTIHYTSCKLPESRCFVNAPAYQITRNYKTTLTKEAYVHVYQNDIYIEILELHLSVGIPSISFQENLSSKFFICFLIPASYLHIQNIRIWLKNTEYTSIRH
jgi:hypothetical protein